MNPMTNMKNVQKLSEQELYRDSKSSWHDLYRDSAWIFVGGLPFELSEGDIICIFSQYGEIVNINLIRDKDSGKSKGYCFLCYEDQRSTILAVDNFNGIKILKRTIRVDHVSNYKVPKQGKKTDDATKKLYQDGCAPKEFKPIDIKPVLPAPQDLRETLADTIMPEIRLPPRLPIYSVKEEPIEVKDEPKEEAVVEQVVVKKKKSKKEKKEKHRKKKRKNSDKGNSSDEKSELERKRKA